MHQDANPASTIVSGGRRLLIDGDSLGVATGPARPGVAPGTIRDGPDETRLRRMHPALAAVRPGRFADGPELLTAGLARHLDHFANLTADLAPEQNWAELVRHVRASGTL